MGTLRRCIALGIWLACQVASAAPANPVWTDRGDVAASNAAQTTGNAALPLRHAADAPYNVTSSRTIDGLQPGSYTVHAHVRSSGGENSCFIFGRADGYTMARTSVPASAEFREIVIPSIPVSNGHLVVGLHTDAGAGKWAELADISVTKDDVARPFLAGGDVSVLSLLEEHGARYYNRAGQAKDALEILRDSGYRIVRLRLYDDPGSGHGNDGYYWPESSMNLPDLLKLARRAEALGLQIELTFHYSDFWTNADTQGVPAAWVKELRALPDGEKRFARLRELVFERTRTVMQALQAQHTVPQFVSIGNEIQAGMLYPYGKADDANWPHLAALLQAGYEGVKAVSPESRVVIHLDDAGNLDKYRYFFDHMQANGAQWDVIGMSYYPFWSKKPIENIVEFNKQLVARYNKDLMVMEVGFNWRPTLPNGFAGQLSDNGPYPAEMSSPQGQHDFLDNLFQALKGNGRVLGLLYWDPIMIATPGVGWAVRESDGKPASNMVSNTTLFDFSGHALPALDVWRDHAAAMAQNPVPANPQPNSPNNTNSTAK
jgi:arabinogalactan endo-1,4-beta-galactosidase